MASSTSNDAELLAHDAFYLPWRNGASNFSAGIAFGEQLALMTGFTLQVAIHSTNQIPTHLKKAGYITARSRRGGDRRRVVLALHPSHRLFIRALPHDASPIVAVEHPSGSLRGWAMFAGALNVETGETMSDPLGEEERMLYQRILWNGHDGWIDPAGRSSTLHDLERLRTLGRLDRDLMLGYVLPHRHFDAVTRLGHLVNQVAQ